MSDSRFAFLRISAFRFRVSGFAIPSDFGVLDFGFTMTHRTFDAVVIGGGIIGVSAAYHLARRGVRVAILEKGPHVAAGSTGQSSAVVRQLYANVEVVQLAYSSLCMFQNWCERLELKESRCGFMPVGVVWIADARPEAYAAGLAHFRQVGAAGGLYSTQVLRERYPSLNLCTRGLDMTGALGHGCEDPATLFWEPEAGFADPQGTTEDLLRAAIARGAELFLRHQVTSIAPAAGGGFAAVRCADGDTFSCKLLLNAAGPWCMRVNAMVGVTLPMQLRPTRVQIATRDRPAELTGEIPVFVSKSDQIYGRPERHGGQLLVGSIAPEDESEPVADPDAFDTHASREFRDRMMHKLHHRFAMKSRGTVRGYAALYTVNTVDWHPIIDAAGPPGYFVANGFSGHGFKLGPSLGALIARLMTGLALPDDPPVDIRFFAAQRRPLVSSQGVLA
jgi:glycine/D-amino acid oxidase-like deaminating enzyme